MEKYRISRSDRFGLVRPAVDAHTLGISSLEQLLAECGFQSITADAFSCEAFNNPENQANAEYIVQWIRDRQVTMLGFSYRLDPEEGAEKFRILLELLNRRRLFSAQGGPLKAIYFAGLPSACEIVRARHPGISGVFSGDESPSETLAAFGINPKMVSAAVAGSVAYDDDRISFGRELIRAGDYLMLSPQPFDGYPEFGTPRDTLTARVRYKTQHELHPVMRAHVGPYDPDRDKAVRRFLDWTKTLARSGFLDVLSIGTSQLTQSHFGKDWGDLPNGGGVPLNSPAEYVAVWQAARPMLVRTYAGTRNIPALARMYEDTIHIAWHALSLWWFCRIDGRGPNAVRENLREHIETMRFIAATGKPFEANVSHHFAFRGADDVTYIVSAVLAARMAKRMGIRHFVLQNMLNTPKYTWGVQDLAKSRAMLRLVRELQDDRFTVFLQPRGGLDYFSSDSEKARAQLAAVTALMDDIEPHNPVSPQIIHVVSYSEASHLADPAVVNESIRITHHALASYRKLRRQGLIDDMTKNPEVIARTDWILSEARTILQAIEGTIPDPYSAEGLYRIFAEGFLPTPYLWECKDEFQKAISWQTRLIQGGVKVVGQNGKPIAAADRIRQVCFES